MFTQMIEIGYCSRTVQIDLQRPNIKSRTKLSLPKWYSSNQIENGSVVVIFWLLHKQKVIYNSSKIVAD